MLEDLSRYWWVVALRGVFAGTFGVIALFWPEVTVNAVVLLFGVFALVDSVFAVASAVSGANAEARHRGLLILEGAVGIAVAVVTFIWPNITTLVLLSLLGLRAVTTGALTIVIGIRWRHELENERLLGLSGVVSIAFGFFLFVFPQQGTLVVATLMGVYGTAFGAMLVGFTLQLKHRGERLSTAPAAS